ncbi:ttll3 [Symbiodinium natans]|uniref:Ttll3 protein n=1 Tax=Symbiodinium natans TaxID=878477 RepID=A0A812ILY1_9DINO|nr:ttll3 [Symbiodinium natans]
MDASVQGTQRTVDRVVGELGRVQDLGDSLRNDLEKRLSQQSKMLNVFKTDLEVKLVSLENRYDKLSDDLWGEETGLAKVMHDLSHTNEVVTSMSTEFASMKHDKASIAQLQMVQEEVNNFTLETNNNVTALQQTVDRMMADMKAHFQTATNTVAAHNAAMLQEVRTAYQEELHEAAQVRKKVDEFMQSEREYRRALEDSICKSQAQTEDLVRQVTSEVEEVGKLRRRDRNSQEVEIKAVAKQLSTVQDSSQHVAQSLEHLSAVIWTMVQCERAASALDLQDDQDRSKIALMGYKEEQSGERPRGGSRTRSIKGRASSPSASEADGQTIINVDERCLSCCGKAQTVLSGFKMACLQYSPAPVVFSRKTYNRSDLLGLREKLLSQVHEALQHGPVEFDKAEIFGATTNTTISSGAIVDSLTGQDGRLSKGSRSSPLSMPPIQSARSTPIRAA